MPFHIKAEQDAFKWQVIDGLPIADVVKWGQGYWIACCPLCSYIHNLPANIKPDGQGIDYKPNCIAKKVHSHMYHAWVAKHPTAWQFDTIRLMLRAPKVIPLDSPQIAVAKAA